MIITALSLFIAGSILCAVAPNMPVLIMARGLQGLGGGGVQPLASTIVGDLYTGAARARVQGYMSSTWGISAVAGPLLGAFIVQHVGWPAIFWVNVPFGILCIAIVVRYFDERIERHPQVVAQTAFRLSLDRLDPAKDRRRNKCRLSLRERTRLSQSERRQSDGY